MTPPPLSALVGSWDLLVRHELMPEPVSGRATFAWGPGDQFLEVRSTTDHPQVPDSLSVIGEDAMHYFDSRGVQRVYESSVRDGSWILYREAPDPFWQRFTMPLGEDVAEARWDRSEDEGASWQLDVAITYTRAG